MIGRASLTLMLAAVGCGSDAPRPLTAQESGRLDRVVVAGEAIRPLHARKGPATKGEWLADHPEEGQTFAQYRAKVSNGPTAGRTTIYVQPIGTFIGRKKDLLDKTVEALGLFYNLPVKTLKPIDEAILPKSALRDHPTTRLPQVDSLSILRLLRGQRPDDAVAVLALTDSDLWPKGDRQIKNFVFGQASLGERVGVWSIARLGDPDLDFPTCLRRTLQVALHETGHMFSIQHCAAYECGMNGSNSLSESDGQPMAFCAECEMKVGWTLKVGDPAKRYAALAEFAGRNGLNAEAKGWRADEKASGAR